MIEEAGLEYAPPTIVPNTLPSLQLGEFARDADRLEALHPVLFRAYWAEGRDIGDHQVLGEVAEAAGLDAAEAVRAIHEERYTERVLESTDGASRIGVDGVPAWLVDDRLLVPGAQPHEVFDRALARLGYGAVEIAGRVAGDGGPSGAGGQGRDRASSGG